MQGLSCVICGFRRGLDENGIPVCGLPGHEKRLPGLLTVKPNELKDARCVQDPEIVFALAQEGRKHMSDTMDMALNTMSINGGAAR